MNIVFLRNRPSPFGFKNRQTKPVEKTRNEIIREKKEAGVPVKDIAEEYGISVPRVYQLCQKS